MNNKHYSLETVFVQSENVVAREIEGEVVIVPITAGIGDTENELYSLNETGRAIWILLDGKNSIRDIISRLLETYDAGKDEIERDVRGLLHELNSRGIVSRT